MPNLDKILKELEDFHNRTKNWTKTSKLANRNKEKEDINKTK